MYSHCGSLNIHHRCQTKTLASFRHFCSAARNSCESWSMVQSQRCSSDRCGPFAAESSVSNTSPYHSHLFDQEQTHAYRDAEPCQHGAESPVLIPASHIEINKPFFPQHRDLSSHRWDSGSNNPLSVAFFFLPPPASLLLGIHSQLMRQISCQADKEELI